MQTWLRRDQLVLPVALHKPAPHPAGAYIISPPHARTGSPSRLSPRAHTRNTQCLVCDPSPALSKKGPDAEARPSWLVSELRQTNGDFITFNFTVPPWRTSGARPLSS